ncbi:hypothetical protein AAFF_G00224840 [Aldrovandia affinis]|uniref:CARD domain-containing protein n=1 Tax=Aldrovandia affinis TaxID=143900 RepID=A0AAD7X1G1_9TELE|nr:hypothetical protein AAFF_G00224840 [Aldrovandia affinis]
MFGSGTRKWFVKKQRNDRKPSVRRKKKKWAAKILKQHRERILKELDVNKVLPYLVYDKVFSLGEYKEILGYDTSKKRAEIFLDQLSLKGPGAFYAFCSVLEEVCPHLLTCFLLDIEECPAVQASSGRHRKEERFVAPHNQDHFLSREHRVMRPPPIYTDPVFDPRVTPSSDASTAAASSVSVSQGKPSLRRIKGRIHRSKSLDSIDLLDSNWAPLASCSRKYGETGFIIIIIIITIFTLCSVRSVLRLRTVSRTSSEEEIIVNLQRKICLGDGGGAFGPGPALAVIGADHPCGKVAFNWPIPVAPPLFFLPIGPQGVRWTRPSSRWLITLIVKILLSLC